MQRKSIARVITELQCAIRELGDKEMAREKILKLARPLLNPTIKPVIRKAKTVRSKNELQFIMKIIYIISGA